MPVVQWNPQFRNPRYLQSLCFCLSQLCLLLLLRIHNSLPILIYNLLKLFAVPKNKLNIKNVLIYWPVVSFYFSSFLILLRHLILLRSSLLLRLFQNGFSGNVSHGFSLSLWLFILNLFGGFTFPNQILKHIVLEFLSLTFFSFHCTYSPRMV